MHSSKHCNLCHYVGNMLLVPADCFNEVYIPFISLLDERDQDSFHLMTILIFYLCLLLHYMTAIYLVWIWNLIFSITVSSDSARPHILMSIRIQYTIS